MKLRKLSDSERALWESAMQGRGMQHVVSNQVVAKPQVPRRVVRPLHFDPVLDLHYMTLQEAHEQTLLHLAEAYHKGFKRVVLITGRSGPIAREFPLWIEHNAHVRKRKLQTGGGAWTLWLKKNTSR